MHLPFQHGGKDGLLGALQGTSPWRAPLLLSLIVIAALAPFAVRTATSVTLVLPCDPPAIEALLWQGVRSPAADDPVARALVSHYKALLSAPLGFFSQEEGDTPGNYPPSSSLNNTQVPCFGCRLTWNAVKNFLKEQPPDGGIRKLFLFMRHAESTANACASPLPCGNCTYQDAASGDTVRLVDAPLTDTGRQQAAALQAFLAAPLPEMCAYGQEDPDMTWVSELGLDSIPIYTSPNARTLQTTASVFFPLGSQTPVVSELLRSKVSSQLSNYRSPVTSKSDPASIPTGPWAPNCSMDLLPSLATQYGDQVQARWHPAGTPGLALRSDIDTMWRSDAVESDKSVAARALAFVHSVFALPQNSSSIVGVVTHSEIISALAMALWGVDLSTVNTEIVPMIIDYSDTC